MSARGSDREQMLASIRAALGRDAPSPGERQAVADRLDNPLHNLVPQRGRADGSELIARFIAEAERVNAVVRTVASWDAVPSIVAALLHDLNMSMRLKLAPHPLITAIPWACEPTLSFSIGAATADDLVAVTGAYAGIGETGTLMLVSGSTSPTNLNFLPEVHVVVLPTTWVVGTYEDAWECLRVGSGEAMMPRVVNWITGPSRTADIEQTLLLGAHGPKQLLIVLVDAEPQPTQT